MGKYEDYLKKKEAAKSGNTSAASSANQQTSKQNSTYGQPAQTSKYDQYLAKKQAAKEAGNNQSFKFGERTFIVDSATGQAKKSKVGTASQSVEDARKERETGHETFFTDITKSLSGGAEQWGAGQLSTLATIPLAVSGIAHKDNYYEPEQGGTLWKMLKASQANTRYANELLEDSKEGRGFVGSTVMDVASQAVTNGIDAAIRSIPGIGTALGTASFMSRSFGGTAQQKRDEGKSIATQVMSGAVSAAIEQFTESASRIAGVRNYTGADIGWLDGVNTKIEAAIASKLGPVIAKMSTSMMSEGLEEIASDILNPIVTGALESVFKDTKLLGDFEAEEWQSIGDIAYDGLVGALSAIGGGMVESLKTSETYNSKDVHRDNKLYAAALRQEYEANKARNKNLKGIYEALEDRLSRADKKGIQQAVQEQTGQFVNKKQALAMYSEAELDGIYKDAAKKFSEQSFANEVVTKEELEEAAYNFLSKGEFADETFQGIDDPKAQISAFAKELMTAHVNKLIEEAKQIKGVKKAARLMQLASIKAKLLGEDTTQQQQTATEEEEITAPRSYRYTQEELEADQARREAELHPEQERPAYVARQEQAQQAQAQQEGWVMRGDTNIYDPRNQAYIQKNNPELWAEYQKAKGMSGDAGVSAMRDATAKMKTYLAEVNRESNVSWQTATEESGLETQHAIIEQLRNQLGIKQENEEPAPTIRRYGMGSTHPVQSAKFTIDRAIQGRLKGTGNADLQLAFNSLIKDIPSISRGSRDFLEQVSDFILGNFEQEFVDNPYGEADSEVKHSYLHRKGSKRGIEVRRDEYSHPTYDVDLTLSDTAKALFNIIQEMDERRLDINHWIAVSSKNSAVDTAEKTKDAVKNAEALTGEREEKLSLRDEDFDMNEDAVRDIVNTLREGYAEGSPTEDAINLRSSLMSGFAPSAEYTISDMTVAQRKKLLALAYPDEDFSISPTNSNEIVDSRVDTEKKEYERGERRWNRRHLKGGAESEDNQTAFGYAPVDSNKQTQIGTNAKGEPIMASGFVESNKSSVKEKLSAQNAISLREEVSSNVKAIQKQIENVENAIANVKTVLESANDDAVKERLTTQLNVLTEDINRLNNDIKEQQNRIQQELGREGNWNSKIREEKRAVFNRTWIDALSDIQLDNIFGDNYNGYYNEHKLTQEEITYGKELLAERKARQGDTSSQFRKDIFKSGTDNARNSGRGRIQKQPYTPRAGEIRQFGRATSFQFGKNNARVLVDGEHYISIYDDSDGAKQCATVLTKAETVGESFDKARAVFSDDKTVKRIIFLRGKIYMSDGTYSGGITVVFSNGDKVILLASDDDAEYESSAIHEKTHQYIEDARAGEVKGLTGGEYYKVVADIVGINIGNIMQRTAMDGGYDINDINGLLDEIVCNAYAGKKCYNTDFSQYKDQFTKFVDGIRQGGYEHEFRDKSLENWSGEKPKQVDFSKLKRFGVGSSEEAQYDKIQNTTGSFLDDMPYAVTSDAKGSVDADDISSKINVGESSKITAGDYVIYVAYSKGTQDRFDSTLNTEPTYTAEVYDGNKLVCITSLSTKQWGHDGAINGLSDRISRAVGAYENGLLKAVAPESNGIGTKAQWRNELNRLIGWKSKGDYNTFKSNGQQSETFTVGNYSVEISSDISENAEPKRGDKYHYKLFDKDGDIVARGTWPMTSAYSPAWLISEDVFGDTVKFGERVGYVARKRGNRVSSTGNTATAETAQARSEFNKRIQEREEHNQDYAERESAEMSDEEFWQSRRADLDMPTLEEFTRGQAEQPTAEKKMSPAAANEIAERSFGKKGRVRATRVVENFPTNFKMAAKALTDAQAEVLNNNLGKMRKALIDINDGYGTVKDAADIYKSWRDNKLLADYYDEDIAARFDKILEDAEAKGWTFEAQDQREFAQAYEEACNAMTAKINNVNKSADRLSRLKTEAIANKLNIKGDGLISKTIQRFIRMQITTDTAMKLFGGFKGSGEFYQLGKDIKDGVAKRMIKYVDAYSHFDNLKKMEGFKEFSQNTKKYQLEFNNEFNEKGVGLDNPLKGVDLSLQQIVTISRLIKTLDKTFEHSDAKAADRVKGFVIRDSNGNSKIIDLGLGDTTDTGEAVKASGKMTAIKLACDRILNQDGAVFEVARAYDKACDAMFKSMGKDVSAVKKALTGNALSLIGEDYTPVLWANDDGSPAEFNFNDDDRLRPPAFLYNRTAKQGNLVVSDISYIVDKYIEKAADYIGTAEIKDTLSRLNDGTSLLDKGKGLNSSLAENFGKDAGTWFDEYVKDLTQYGENDSIWSALRKNMQKGALIGSPSVMMKQTSSYWSAMGLLSPEALAMAYRWKVGVKAADNSEYNKLLKYRHISDNIDPTLTEIIKGVDKYGKASNSRVFQLFTNGISEQDFKTVDNLYTATMIDTYLKNQNKGAEYFTSGEFQNDIDSKFTEVMMRSQPMFDTELRAEYARTDNELVKMTSMFRTQQTQNLNLIATAIGEYNAYKGTGEQGEKLKVLQQTVAGQASAALSLALLSVAADFMLHGLKKYRGDGNDDDEEPGDGKIELGRILGRIGLNTVETGAGTVWFGDSVAKWLIDRMSGGETNEFYGLNMGPITTFKNVLDNLEYVAKSPTASNIKNVATNISQLMGIPLNNAYRIVNSAVMYVEDVVGTNDKNYDDMLKKVTNRTKVNEKNVAGRNLLVESGMTKREATAFVKTVDVDDNGLNKEDLQNYYIEHPEDAERVSILWDSMGWKTKFEKEKKNLDKKVIYNSNPLYAEMDEDESGSVTKTEMMDYALEHEDQIDELSALYKEQGFKGTFRSALKSAENSKLKEQAEDAFYEGDYNVLFDTVSQMKNGKTYLTNLIKDEYDEYDNVSNPLVRYMIDAKRPVKEIDEAVEAYGAKKFIPQYKALRATGLAPKAAIQKLDNFDANANGSITQQELADYYKAHKDEEAMIAEFWKACGWSTTWSKYKKRKKLK